MTINRLLSVTIIILGCCFLAGCAPALPGEGGTEEDALALKRINQMEEAVVKAKAASEKAEAAVKHSEALLAEARELKLKSDVNRARCEALAKASKKKPKSRIYRYSGRSTSSETAVSQQGVTTTLPVGSTTTTILMEWSPSDAPVGYQPPTTLPAAPVAPGAAEKK